MTEQPFMSHAQLQSRKGWLEPRCSGVLRIYDRTGPMWSAECDVCGFGVAFRARDMDPAENAAWLIDRAHFPSRFLDKPFDKDPENEEARDRLREWIGAKLWPAPALFGKPGRGKTHLLVLVARQLIIARHVRLLFKTAPRLLSELQSAMTDSAAYDELWRQAVSVDMLVLDDLGAEMDTDWRADRIAALVNERYEEERPMMVSTNVAPDRWDAAFDARTVSRLREMVFAVELRGPDRRIEVLELEAQA